MDKAWSLLTDLLASFKLWPRSMSTAESCIPESVEILLAHANANNGRCVVLLMQYSSLVSVPGLVFAYGLGIPKYRANHSLEQGLTQCFLVPEQITSVEPGGIQPEMARTGRWPVRADGVQ